MLNMPLAGEYLPAKPYPFSFVPLTKYPASDITDDAQGFDVNKPRQDSRHAHSKILSTAFSSSAFRLLPLFLLVEAIGETHGYLPYAPLEVGL